jgi:hypothetical protein
LFRGSNIVRTIPSTASPGLYDALMRSMVAIKWVSPSSA